MYKSTLSSIISIFSSKKNISLKKSKNYNPKFYFQEEYKKSIVYSTSHTLIFYYLVGCYLYLLFSLACHYLLLLSTSLALIFNNLAKYHLLLSLNLYCNMYLPSSSASYYLLFLSTSLAIIFYNQQDTICYSC